MCPESLLDSEGGKVNVHLWVKWLNTYRDFIGALPGIFAEITEQYGER